MRECKNKIFFAGMQKQNIFLPGVAWTCAGAVNKDASERLVSQLGGATRDGGARCKQIMMQGRILDRTFSAHVHSWLCYTHVQGTCGWARLRGHLAFGCFRARRATTLCCRWVHSLLHSYQALLSTGCLMASIFKHC